tara:strand:+ start:1501 stop:2064 length:564 start_codon:yes stop_codon:yes gene_type:complete
MPKYKSLSDYKLFISKNSKLTSKVIPGYFYTFDYSYNIDKINKSAKRKDQMSYYDRKPLAFIFNYYKSKDGKIIAEGLNFHHMPVRSRLLLLNIFSKIAPSTTSKDFRITLSPDSMKKLIKRLFIKSKFVFRQYSINRIQRPMQITYSDMKELSRYTPETFESRQFDEVILNYKLYNPYNVIKKGRK